MTAPASSKPFVITRTFAAPRALVWQVWTQPEHMGRWFSPKGFARVSARMDLRPGGIFLYGLKAPNGLEMWGKWIFREITPPERLVWEQCFSNAEGGVERHPMAREWPLRMLSTATFTEADGQTTIRLEWTTLDASPSEQKLFDDSHGSMQGGWTGTFDQLEAYLANPATGGSA
jgi:uncharacterized protein YndB with AHSA1/START domain